MGNDKSRENGFIWKWIFIPLIILIIAIGLIYYLAIAGSTGSNSKIIFSNNVYITKTNLSKGFYLTDLKGRSLYVFDKDINGKSSCYGPCASAWPAYIAKPSLILPKNITLTKRTDNALQYSYKGRLLYYFILDIQPGNTFGDGLEGTWHLAKP